MALLTLEQIEKIEQLTGYSTYVNLVRVQLQSEFTQPTIDRVLECLDELVEIDALLKESRQTSYVKESRGAKLSYAQHIRHLKSDGSNILREICKLLGINLLYNKYSTSPGTVAYW